MTMHRHFNEKYTSWLHKLPLCKGTCGKCKTIITENHQQIWHEIGMHHIWSYLTFCMHFGNVPFRKTEWERQFVMHVVSVSKLTAFVHERISERWQSVNLCCAFKISVHYFSVLPSSKTNTWAATDEGKLLLRAFRTITQWCPPGSRIMYSKVENVKWSCLSALALIAWEEVWLMWTVPLPSAVW